MIRLCINCDTENPGDAVTCSECGMGLTRAPTGETAEEVRSMEGVQDATAPQAKPTPTWALIVLGIVWSVFVGTVGFVCLPVMLYFSYGYRESEYQQYVAMNDAMICGAFLLALAPWVIVPVLRLSRPQKRQLADFAREPEEFRDFARKLEESVGHSGTLACLECGHHNPVGQSECEECGAWVPQTAKARWAYGPRAD